jgi:hypothetical protein
VTPDREEYYRDYEELFATKGWKRMIREAEEMVQTLSDGAVYAPSWDHLCFTKGQVDQLTFLVNLEEVVEQQKRIEEDAAL